MAISEESKMSEEFIQTLCELLQWEDRLHNTKQWHSAKENK